MAYLERDLAGMSWGGGGGGGGRGGGRGGGEGGERNAFWNPIRNNSLQERDS